MNKKLLPLYGLKGNPFSPELPTEAVFITPKVESFLWRIEHNQVCEGGFALITGDWQKCAVAPAHRAARALA